MTASWYGASAVEGFLHSFSGLLTFMSSLLMLFLIDPAPCPSPVRRQARLPQVELAG